jgi:two-component system, chemotaxis family, CheB/CheR fusion protein
MNPPSKLATEFPIVGLGASAGGLAAFEAFFSGLPADGDPGMAFVLVQHLAPDHQSLLTELLPRSTRLPVFEAEDGMAVQPNCVYVIPPNCDLALRDRALYLLAPSEPRGHRFPIDHLFCSLADSLQERSVGVILSGTGSDGTQGVRAIKEAGGMVMVQNPESTEFDGMPRSAIATGLADYELPPAEMLAQLLAYVTHGFGQLPHATPHSEPSTARALTQIFGLLRARTGHDLSLYKPSTIHRRIERRMAVHQFANLDDYVQYLRQTPTEVEMLFRDLLIGVTSFFRDPSSFQVLQDQVIPRLIADKPPGSPIRVWVPGCSTGEEAYSIAILLQERLEEVEQNHPIQVFATDLDRQAILTARTGRYPASIAAAVTPQRLANYFLAEPGGNGYQVRKGLRDVLIFSEQDVTRDPPFSRLDLISCRNLLIYFGPELQRKLLPLFHYSLLPDGVLFLGSSESLGEYRELFTVVDLKAKLYRRKPEQHSSVAPQRSRLLPSSAALDSTPVSAGNASRPSLRELVQQEILRDLPVTAALVHGAGELLYLHGRAGTYFEPVTGEPGTLNLVEMAREGLQASLSTALRTAVDTHDVVRCEDLRIRTHDDFARVQLTVRPLGAETTAREAPIYLVLLQHVSPRPAFPPPASTEGTASDDVILTLKQELHIKREALEFAHEELRRSHEGLRAANEELQSVNEELQSTNEELETSKEELQSLNEELATLNHELQAKVMDLSRANNDMNNLLAGTGIATVFVDPQLCILRFTPSASEIINLIRSDVGRPIAHLVTNLIDYQGLVEDLQGVLSTLQPRDRELQTTSGNWYIMRIRPYRTVEKVIEGAVVTFVEITEMKHIRDQLESANALLHQAAAERRRRDSSRDSSQEGSHE